MKSFRCKNKSGVALIWAIIVMMVSILIVTGILMMAQVYHKRENTAILETQADYYARSGINIVSSQLTSGAFDDELSSTSTMEFKYVVEITDGEDKIPVNIIIHRNVASYQLNIESTYTNPSNTNITKTVFGRMLKQDGSWVFQGYYVE
jgi:type II secretory pathway component PulK